MMLKARLKNFIASSLAVLVLGLGASASAAKAPVCGDIFLSRSLIKNTDYFQSPVWGVDLPRQLQSHIKKEVYLNESQSIEARFESLQGFSVGDLIVAPGHKILRVSSPHPVTMTAESKNILLNAITDKVGKVLFLDVWDGHHRILSSYQKGLKRLSDFKAAGFEVNILINGKPVGSAEPWKHTLPSAASYASWQNRVIMMTAKDVDVAGKYSNYEMGSRTTMAQLARNEAHAKKSKIGIFFGTFDPIHENHIAVAKQAQSEFGLDKVILVPNALPDHKKPTALGLRQAVVLERIKKERKLDAALFDTHYYIENFGKEVLIEKIRQDIGSNNIFLIDGGDSFQKLLDLNQIRPTEVINYIVSKRGEDIRVPEHLKNKVFISKNEMPALSSSDIRQAFAEGRTPEAAQFSKASTQKILSWGLYKTTNPKLYNSEQLYTFIKSSAPIADLQFKGGEASKKQGLTYHHNDVWQMLLPARHKIDDQVAFFKPDTQSSREGKNYLEAEEVGFLLNRLLGMDIVPPTAVINNVKAGGLVHEKGVLSYAVMAAEKLMTETNLNKSIEQQLFFSDARILNVLLHNKDANDRNFLLGRHWKTGKMSPFLIDFSQSFQKDQYLSMTYYPVGHTGEIKVFRKSTFEALKAMNATGLKKNLSHLLSETEIKEILNRRDGILAYVQSLLANPKSVVLF